MAKLCLCYIDFFYTSTNTWVFGRVSPPHYSPSVIHAHTFLPLSKLTKVCTYLHWRRYIHMQAHGNPLMPRMPVITQCEEGAVWAWSGKLLPQSRRKKVCTQQYLLIGASCNTTGFASWVNNVSNLWETPCSSWWCYRLKISVKWTILQKRKDPSPPCGEAIDVLQMNGAERRGVFLMVDQRVFGPEWPR